MRTLIASFFAFVAVALAPVSAAQELAYEDLAKGLLADLGRPDAHPDTIDMDVFLRENFVHTRLGIYDIFVPAVDAGDKTVIENMKVVATALLDGQDMWLQWTASGGDTDAARADIKKLKGWVKSWSKSKLSAASKKGAADLLEMSDAKEAIALASQRFGTYMGLGKALNMERETELHEPMILIPKRARFVEIICFGGWLYPDLRGTFWVPGIIDWTNTFIEGYNVIALEYAHPDRTFSNYTKSISMNSRTQTGMQQQVVQLGANALLDNYYGSRIPPSIAGGLAINLVIDVYGECNTNVDGDLRTRRAEAREMFVPGGQSQGGVLPQNMADGRWRGEGQGEDRFVGVLRLSQQEGASEAKDRDKTRHFELMDDAMIKQVVIDGPFLGAAAAEAKDPPAAFYGDHLEFLRAYRCCFMWWLKTKSDSSAKKSAAAFADFLRGLARGEDAAGVQKVIEEAFGGRALSSADLERDELEGAFLRWLAKQ